MRVVIVCNWFLRYGVPQACALARAGVSTALLCRSRADEFGGRTEELCAALDRAREAGVTVFTIPGRISDPRSVVAVAQVGSALRRWRPDVVHAHDNEDPRLFALTAGRPCVLTIHDPVPHVGAPTEGAAQRLVRARWLRRADVVHVHGDELVAPIRARTTARVAVVAHGVVVRDEPMPVPAQPRITLFGRLETYKGVPLLARAMELVWDELPDVRLLVAGAGSAGAALPDDPRIELRAGYVPEGALDDVFARARVCVLPYVDASQSGAGLQAVARGIPLVVTDVGALANIVPDRSYVVAPEDPRALAAALVQHVEHDTGVRLAILEHTRARFDWDVVTTDFVDVYRTVVR